MTAEAKLTTQFLHSISSRLSGRTDCRGVEYVVGIGVDDGMIPRQYTVQDLDNRSPENYIIMYPEIKVFPNNKTRKRNFMCSVIECVVKNKYYDELYHGVDEAGCMMIDTSKLVRGTYKYKTSFKGKYRKWIRVR